MALVAAVDVFLGLLGRVGELDGGVLGGEVLHGRVELGEVLQVELDVVDHALLLDFLDQVHLAPTKHEELLADELLGEPVVAVLLVLGVGLPGLRVGLGNPAEVALLGDFEGGRVLLPGQATS